jgi:hypothetical protein
VGLYLGGLLSGSESIVRLVPEWGSIVKSKFLFKEYVSLCIDFNAASCWVLSEFAVVGMCSIDH